MKKFVALNTANAFLFIKKQKIKNQSETGQKLYNWLGNYFTRD